MNKESQGSEGRNGKGQWGPGVSGNRSSRPRRERAVLKSLTDQIADELMEKVPIIDARGRRQMIPACQVMVRELVQSFPELKPNEKIKAMQWMNDLGVFPMLQKRALDAVEFPSEEEMRKALAQAITVELEKMRDRHEQENLPS